MSYSVDVQVFSKGVTYHETITQGDDTPGNVTPTYGLADPLTITQALDSNELGVSAHPLPDEATITLIAATGSTYARLALGDPVAALVYPAASFSGTPASFYGRVSTLTAEPHPLGVIYTLGCLGYLADLAELTVAQTGMPRQTVKNRVVRVFSDAGVAVDLGALVSDTGSPYFIDALTSPTDALSALLPALDWFPPGTGTRDELGASTAGVGGAWDLQRRYRAVPVITGSQLDPVTPFIFAVGVPHSKRIRYSPPARVTNIAGVRTITVDPANSSPSTGAPILDGRRVRFAPAYTQTKGGGVANVTQWNSSDNLVFVFDWRTAPGRVAEPSWLFPVQIDTGGPAVLQILKPPMDQTGRPYDHITLYRVPFRPDMRAAWSVGTLSWQAWSEPSPWRRPELTELLTVANVQASHLPTNREWVAGLVAKTVLTVAKGRPTIDIDLVPNTYDHELQRLVQGATNGVASFNATALSGVTFNQLSTRDTFDDYRLVKGA